MQADLFGSGIPSSLHPLVAITALVGSLVLSLLIAWVYKLTHRGLTYSQSFQFSLILLGMLGTAIMIVASGSLLRAIGILGAFSIIRFRTAIKDPKDMAYIMFVLSVGLAMGAEMFAFAIALTVLVCIVIIVLTKMNFGMTQNHESIIRLMCKGEKKGAVATSNYEALLAKLSDSFRLLNAHARGDHMELTYGVRPRRGSTALSILEAIRHEQGIEDAELFDAKHQVEF